VQIFLAQGEPRPAGCSVYVVIGECDGSYSVGAAADELFEFQRANGVDIVEEPGDRPWGLRDFTIRDLHGYVLTFGHRLLNEGPPLRIERVDVPVRLEKRFAALLRDLAAQSVNWGLREYTVGVQLRNARMCLDCEEIHELSSADPRVETFVYLARWIPVGAPHRRRVWPAPEKSPATRWHSAARSASPRSPSADGCG
jgi:hypothetical protein